jgi:hypothetical protein
MHDVVLREQFQCLGHIEDDPPELVLVVPDSSVEILIVNAVHFLSVELLTLQLIQRIP